MSLKIIPAYDHPQETGELFSEYTKMLIDADPTFQDYLGLQNYEEELKHLEVSTKYSITRQIRWEGHSRKSMRH